MKIANIIYEGELVNHKQVEFINYHKINEYSSTIFQDVDISLPTLIVGWKFLKETLPDYDVNILKHKIVENQLYWEFSFDENKSSHVSGVKSFVRYAPEFYFSKYSYTNIDPIFHQLKDNQDLYDILPQKIDAYYYYKEDIIYFLSDGKISGLNIEIFKFFKFDIQAILNKLDNRTSGAVVHDSDGELHQKYYKIFPDFNRLKRYIVVLLTK